MSKIKVLQVVGSLKIGGLELVALNYFKYIDRTKFEFDYLVYENEKGELEDEVYKLGGKVIRIPYSKSNLFKYLKDLKSVFSDYGPYDVVHSHTFFNNGIVMKVAKLFKIPIRISHSHSAKRQEEMNIKKNIYINLMRLSINANSTDILACSNVAGDYLYGNKFKKNGVIIKNGINVKKYIYDQNIRNNIRNKYNLNDKFVIGHVGKLSKVKNQDFILDIFKKVKKKNDNVKLILIGEDDLNNELQKKSRKNYLDNDILFMGARDNVYHLLQGMDLFLFPSKHEGLGIALIEAQAAGLHCIVSDSVPKESTVTDLVDRLSLSSNPSIWVNQILKYNNNYKRVSRYNEIISTGYDIENSIKQIEKIYQNRPL